MKIFIIAGGYSLKGFDFSVLKDKGLIIGIKDAFLYTHCDIGLNMDRVWYEHRYDKLVESGKKWYLRDNCLKNKNLPLLDTWEMFLCNYKTDSLSPDPKQLNGSNSGFCALNLAYQMNPKEIYLLGYDMGKTGNNVYWYPFYEYHETKNIKHAKYVNWGKEFYTAARQCKEKGIKVYNVNPQDTIGAFDNITFEKFRKMI